MQDPLWQAVYDAVLPALDDEDVLLAPIGDWPGFPCAARFYDVLIDIRDETVVILHKGRLAGADKAEIGWLATEWERLFVNGVFVVFTRYRKKQRLRHTLRHLLYYDTVGYYLTSASRRKLRHRIFYLHLPKASGSSMWLALRRALPASIYYTSLEQFLRHPPGQDYDLIGGHLSLSALMPHLTEDDWIIGMMRHPTDRFRSAFLHSRRATEIVPALGSGMRGMRDLHIGDFLDTQEGGVETRLQLLMLGQGLGAGTAGTDDRSMLEDALVVLDHANIMFGPSEAPQAFLDQIARHFRLRVPRLPHVNRNDYLRQSADVREFDTALRRINEENRLERELYRWIRCLPLSPPVHGSVPMRSMVPMTASWQ